MKTCPRCLGGGKQTNGAQGQQMMQPCPTCGGRGKVAETIEKVQAGLVLAGSLLAALGFILPWITVKFTPPPSGILQANGQRLNAFQGSFNGFNIPDTSFATGHIIPITIISLVCIGLLSALTVYPVPGARRLSAAIQTYYSTHVSNTLLISTFTGVKKAIDILVNHFHLPLTKSLLNMALTLLLTMESLAWLGLVLLALILGKIEVNGTNQDVTAYTSVKLGLGLWALITGFVLSGVGTFIAIVINKSPSGNKVVRFIDALARKVFSFIFVGLLILGLLALAYLLLNHG